MSVPAASVIIPAHNEAAWITPCLDALFASTGDLPQIEVLVVANGCSDDTAEQARSRRPVSNWELRVIETDTAGKLHALNTADRTARGAIRIYLDADVRVSPPLVRALLSALDPAEPRYATGTPHVTGAISMASRAYARFWSRLPFVKEGTPGFGVFAVNAAGRALWDDWPDIIADDMFARLQFSPAARVRVPATYDWPPVEGLGNLIRVRRRQNAGVSELTRAYPALVRNEDKGRLGMGAFLGLALRDPVGFATYAGVSIGVRTPFFAQTARWARGR